MDWEKFELITQFSIEKWDPKVLDYIEITEAQILLISKLHDRLKQGVLLIPEIEFYEGSDRTFGNNPIQATWQRNVNAYLDKAIESFHKLTDYSKDQQSSFYELSFSQHLEACRFLFEILSPHIAYYQGESGENSDFLNKLLKETDSKINSIEEQLESANILLRQSLSSVFQRSFGDTTGRFDRASKVWLSSLIGWALIGAIGLFFYFRSLPYDPKWSIMALFAYAVFPKLFALSVYSFGIALCAKNHKINRHNYIIYNQRICALQAISSLNNMVGDDKASRNAVLVQALSACLQHQPTGLNDQKGDTFYTPIEEITKNILSKG